MLSKPEFYQFFIVFPYCSHYDYVYQKRRRVHWQSHTQLQRQLEQRPRTSSRWLYSVGLYSRQRTGHASMPSNAKFCYEESYQHSQSSVQGSPEIMCRICAAIPLLIYGTSLPIDATTNQTINTITRRISIEHTPGGV